MTPCAITHAACIQLLFSASCFLLSASNSPLPALCTQRPVLHSCIKLSASSFLLSAPCFLLSCTPLPTSCLLRSLLSALSPLFPALSALSPLLPALSALCPQLSAFRSLPFNIGTLRKMVFREVVSMGSEPQLFHTSKKRVRSATSRRTPTLSVYYQLAFFTPGMRPFEAISRNWIRLMPN